MEGTQGEGRGTAALCGGFKHKHTGDTDASNQYRFLLILKIRDIRFIRVRIFVFKTA